MAANPLHCVCRVFAATRRNASLADLRISGNFHDHNIRITTPGIFKNCARDIDSDNTPLGQIFINIAAHAIFKSMRLPHQGKCSSWRLVHQKPAHQGSRGPRLRHRPFGLRSVWETRNDHRLQSEPWHSAERYPCLPRSGLQPIPVFQSQDPDTLAPDAAHHRTARC